MGEQGKRAGWGRPRSFEVLKWSREKKCQGRLEPWILSCQVSLTVSGEGGVKHMHMLQALVECGRKLAYAPLRSAFLGISEATWAAQHPENGQLPAETLAEEKIFKSTQHHRIAERKIN